MFEQIKLAYGYNALEPYIDELTMQTHYTKHHAAYTNNLNAAIEKSPALHGKSIEEVFASLDKAPDEATKTAIRNNGGGFYNHNLYFDIMSPNPQKAPDGKLAEQIDKDFGSVDALKEKLSALAAGRFGSGWAWLSVKKGGGLEASSSPNQDNPLIEGKGSVPIIGIDVWEHAYYLKYKNLRPDYVKAFWEVLDWAKVGELYNENA